MARPYPLQAVLELARRASDDAAAELGGRNAQWQKARAKLDLLLHYREEYRARFRATVQQDVHHAGWKNFHDFMDKLDQAIEQQRHAVAQSARLAQEGQRRWQLQQQRLKAFETLAQRHAVREAQHAARGEQRKTDELVSQARSRQRASR